MHHCLKKKQTTPMHVKTKHPFIIFYWYQPYTVTGTQITKEAKFLSLFNFRPA
jgi:hypothetical protein